MSKFGKIAAAAGVLAILTQGVVSAELSRDESEAVAVFNAESVEKSGYYVLREWNGKIALFEEGDSEPLTVYNTKLLSLYPADVELLREGIRVKTRFEVARLIEDLELE